MPLHFAVYDVLAVSRLRSGNLVERMYNLFTVNVVIKKKDTSQKRPIGIMPCPCTCPVSVYVPPQP